MGSTVMLIDGTPPEELLGLPPRELDALLLDRPNLVFSVGSARILGGFRLRKSTLVIELGHIDGGGEGVLRLLWVLARRYARSRGLREIEWLVHAVSCPHPNQKLRRVLVRRGFIVESVPEVGVVYRLIDELPVQVPQPDGAG